MVNNDEPLNEMLVLHPEKDHDSPASSEPSPTTLAPESSSSQLLLIPPPPETTTTVKAEDETYDDEEATSRLSPTSLYCSLPLNRDVQTIIDTFSKTEERGAADNNTSAKKKVPRKLPCLYCERTFVADNLRAKHVERSHSIKQARRSSSRFQQTAQISAAPVTCQFCTKFAPADSARRNLEELFAHLIDEHRDRYFACVTCKERFLSKLHLDEHTVAMHDHANHFDFKVPQEDFKVPQEVPSMISSDVEEKKESRNKRVVAIKSTKFGIKRSARLQNKDVSVTNANGTNGKSGGHNKKKIVKTNKMQSATEEPTTTTGDRDTIKVSPNENPYPTFDAFYRVKKITDHSIDNLRIASLTFNDVFDQAFFTRIKCNIRENLLNHIDGKLFKNEESESRISNFEKTAQVEVPSTENNYGCELSLNAATPVATFLVPQQLCDDPESQIEYGSKASKKKTTAIKQDEVHYKYFTRRKYQASILESKENRDLSKLDMWTQVVVKSRQQCVLNKSKTDKELQDYKRGDEYKDKKLNKELNRILDRRGPFEDLIEEACKKAALEGGGNINREAHVEACSVLEDILQGVFSSTKSTEPPVLAETTKTELTDREIPSYLNLRKASSLTNDSHIDRSDKITLICSSEETENFEAPQVPPRDKNALVELTGEWSRSRIYICAACGIKAANMRSLIDHKNVLHQNVWCHHYEFVGNQGAFYKNLSIPGLGKMEAIESTPGSKSWQRSDARLCTKCKKQCNTLGELHRHILECGEDWSWMLARKKCKYRPFGSKARRKRRGLFKRIINKEKATTENREKKTYKREGPRIKPSDAETIQRMLSNLPAKRATRKIMSLKDGFPTKKSSTSNKASTSARKKEPSKPSTETTASASSSSTTKSAEPTTTGLLRQPQRKVIVSATKCNPVANVRKSVRNINKVISSALIDNNLIVKRKVKALQRSSLQRTELPEMPLALPELTDEQKAEEVKKKMSFLKKVQSLRKSVIKKQTTVNESDSRSQRAATVVKTRSSASPKAAATKTSKFGRKLMQGLSLRRNNIRTNVQNEDTQEEPAEKTEKSDLNVTNKRKLSTAFGSIKRALKKMRISKNNKVGETVEPNLPPTIETTTTTSERGEEQIAEITREKIEVTPPENDHFLEESSQEKVTRTISNSSDKDTDKDCDPGHREISISDTDLPQAPLIEPVVEHKDLPEEKLPTPVVVVETNAAKCKGKLVKRGKGLNDCIAMLTSKLIGNNKTELETNTSAADMTKVESIVTVTVVPPIVVDKTLVTEEQNVVIPEETVNVSLESAKEPEECLVVNDKLNDTALTDTILYPKTICDSDVVHESITQESTTKTSEELSPITIGLDEKENFEMEQKSLPLTQQKQLFGDVDLKLDKVEDILKCIEDISSKDIINGHVDNTITEFVGFNRSKKNSKRNNRGKKGGMVNLNNAILAEDSFVDPVTKNGNRKIGSKRRLPQRKSKIDQCDLPEKLPEIEINLDDKPYNDKNPKKNLSTILEEDICESLLHKVKPQEENIKETTETDTQENTKFETETERRENKKFEDILKDVEKIVEKPFQTEPLVVVTFQPHYEMDILERKDIIEEVVVTDSEDELPLSKLKQQISPLKLNRFMEYPEVSENLVVAKLDSVEIMENITENIFDTPKEEIISKQLTEATPVKPKRRGRKSKTKIADQINIKSSIITSEQIENKDNSENKIDNSEKKIDKNESSTITPKKRGRRKKVISKPPETPEETAPTIEEALVQISVAPVESVIETSAEKVQKNISIYDFNEESNSLGDNSKENIIEKQFSPKRPKRTANKIRETQMKQIEMEELNDNANDLESITPLKDHKNIEDSFIQTPDLDNSTIEKQIVQNFKVKRGLKSKKSKDVDDSSNIYCEICNKHFVRSDNLVKHKRTLTHIAKLSEIEALESQSKQVNENVQKEESLQVVNKIEINETPHIDQIEEPQFKETQIPQIQNYVTQIEETQIKNTQIKETQIKETYIEATQIKEIHIEETHNKETHIDETNIEETQYKENQIEQTPVSVIDSTISKVLVKSPFGIDINNDTPKLVDIISDVLNKPVEESETKYVNDLVPSPPVEQILEPKRYKSLGERKSFDSDSSRLFAHQPSTPGTFEPSHISPPHLIINNKNTDAYVNEQISLLENILVIQDNQKPSNSLNDDDDEEKSLDLGDSFEDENFDEDDGRCPSDMSLVSDIKADDSSQIISHHHMTETIVEEKFVKPPNQYDELSEDSLNNRVYDERTRKTLNRDEELFLECCSLLKSSSEVSNFSKKSFNAKVLTNHYAGNLKSFKNANVEFVENEWTADKINGMTTFLEEDDSFLSDSCPNTPIGGSYDQFSNSDTKSEKSEWNDDDKSIDNSDTLNFKNYESSRNQLDLMSSDMEDNTNNAEEDFTRKFDAKFGGLMAEAMKSNKPKKNRAKRKTNKTSDHVVQTSITDYTTRLAMKSPEDSMTSDSKKMPVTKGAMKVFEGLKVSIPTDDLDMNQVLNCSPTSKRLELELKNQVITTNKEKTQKPAKIGQFGNKLGLKVTKKPKSKTNHHHHHHHKKSASTIVPALLTEEKIPDVYDFEETQDNTDLFTPNNIINPFITKSKKEKNEFAHKSDSNDTDSNNRFLLSLNENQSVSSMSTTETESNTSKKPVDNTAITKKKCKIMGRIFKNAAFKTKIDDEIVQNLLETPPIINDEPLENVIIDSEDLLSKPSVPERPKMTEKEMDMLFDKLLEDAARTKPVAKKPVQKEKNDEKHLMVDAPKNEVSKSSPPVKRKKRGRKSHQNEGDSSDDEFNLTPKAPKKRTARKPKDNGSINLEQELKECMGVAGRKSQRKCTSGKQNVLIEDWSSDDSEFEAMCRLSLQQNEKELKDRSAAKHHEEEEKRQREEEFDFKEDETVVKILEDVAAKNKIPKKAKKNLKPMRNKSAETNDVVVSTSKTKSQTSSPATLASNRRKRAAGDTLYYWSSSSDEDDTQNLIETKNVREDEYSLDDQEDRPTQHGWIVGDSPKKLVTMLAQAKGKKQIDGKCVKEQGKKRTSI